MSIYHQERANAIKWWNMQSTEYKKLQYNQYKKDHFTPAISESYLTGREIQIIYSNLKLSEQAIKTKG